ncbi:MAG: DNA polymerase III subunit beta [Patescibacteria group bacterium]
MKIELLQEDLNRGLSIVSRFVASRPQLPVLANILLKADKNQLHLSATNLEIGICLDLNAKVVEEGEITVPAKEITELISYLSPGKLTLESKGKAQLKTIWNGGETVFAGIEASEFPKIPDLPTDSLFSLSVKDLMVAISQVNFATASDDTRPVLEAILWSFEKTGYRVVATDGYRLSLKDVKEAVEVSNGDKPSFLVPGRSLTEITRLTGDEQQIKVGLTKDKNQVGFILPGLKLVSRLIEGEFPDYQKIIPEKSKVTVSLSKDEFYQAIKVASVFSRESANIVKFDVGKDGLTISANAPSVGENKTEVSAKIKWQGEVGEDLKIAFNYKFILDFLNAVADDEQEIVIELTEALAPVIFKTSQAAWLHLIMPVRVDL